MATSTTRTNKPINPRGNDQSPKGYNRAALYSGKALDFDGVNDEITGSSALNFTTQTITGYFYLDTTSGSQFIIDTRDNPNDGMVLWFNSANSKMQYLINDGTNAVETEAVETGKWYFISATYDGTTQSIYLNGQLSASRATSQTINVTTAYRVGARSFTTPLSFWNGKLANIKAFNVALTAAQIADLYNNPEKIVPTGVDNTALKLWLPMMEGAGTTALNGAPDALGSEIVTNGTFDSTDDWSHSAEWSIGSGNASFSGSSSGKLYQTGKSLVGTKNYILTFDVSNASTYANIWIGNQAGLNSYTASATYQTYYNGTNAVLLEGVNIGTETTLAFYANSIGSSFDIDNISLKEVANCGTISGATWTHGIGSPVAQTSVIDWNKWKLEGGSTTNEYLIPQGLTAGRDLLGNLFENVRKQGALNLDGLSFAEVHKNDSVPEGGEDRTLEVWVYYRPQTTFQSMMELGEKTALKRFAILAKNIAGGNYIYIAGQSYDTDTSVAYDSNAWNHIVVTLEGSSQKVYKNGALINTVSRSSYNTTLDTIEIGRNKENLLEYSYSSVAQPRIYNRALTAEEVERNYNAGKNTYKN